jgi:hypothetical protein
LAEAGRRSGRFHFIGVLAQQRLHLAALLIAFTALPVLADDIQFQPTITDADFAKFARVVAQAIFASPVAPARASGVLGFDIGIAATAVPVDTNAAWWRNSVASDFSHSGYLAAPRLVVSKGLSAATISATYASRGSIKAYGGALDLPIVHGSVASPELALRASYATLSGVDVLRLKTYGLEAFISKGFGPITPYGAVGRQRNDARGTITVAGITRELADKPNITRYTAGVRISMLFPKITVEATKAEVTSYAAKISFGF